MTNAEWLKALRHDLNLTVVKMAKLLSFTGKNATTKLREMERGTRDIQLVTLDKMRELQHGK